LKSFLKILLLLMVVIVPVALWEYHKNVIVPWTTMPETDPALLDRLYRQYENEVRIEAEHPPQDKQNLGRLLSKTKCFYKKNGFEKGISCNHQDEIAIAIEKYKKHRIDFQNILAEYRPMFKETLFLQADFSFDNQWDQTDVFSKNSIWVISLNSLICLEAIALIEGKKENEAADLLRFSYKILKAYYRLPVLTAPYLAAGAESRFITGLLYLLTTLPESGLSEFSEYIADVPGPKESMLLLTKGEMVTNDSMSKNDFFVMLFLHAKGFNQPFWYDASYLGREKEWSRYYHLEAIRRISKEMNAGNPGQSDLFIAPEPLRKVKTCNFQVDSNDYASQFKSAYVLRTALLKTVEQEKLRRQNKPFEKSVPYGKKGRIVFENGRWRN